MTTFDALFFNVFQHYKTKKIKSASGIAVFYISFLQCSLLLVLGVFFTGFFRSMHVAVMSAGKAWTLFGLVVVSIYFKNWMKYGGRKRKVLNANMLKNKKLNYSIGLLWFLPMAILGLAFVLLQAV
ncbi:hypothetical protein [Flavisericum labens]|uniref:hypothetical protein n=1 Tax=Flavisericum labens TaxID=3377112 RepID=UPI00387AB101